MTYQDITADEAIKLYYEQGKPVEYYHEFQKKWIRMNPDCMINDVFTRNRKFRRVIE